MDHFAPGDWSSNMGDASAPFSAAEDDGLFELLWRSGHVVMQSQAPPRPAVREQEEAPWFQYSVVDEIDGSLEKDLFSEFFGGPCKEEDGEERGNAVTALWGGLMPTPIPLTEKAGFWGEDARGSPPSEGNESSVVTIGSRRVCSRSDHAQTPSAPLRGGKASDTMSHHDTSATLTSLSTWSRPSGSSKRKLSDGAESLSEVIQDVESESADEPGQKPTTGKRRRIAQVHNLSERRRRDRINEKLRALQELVPHCNKTDKASMLDEAIEYLKSLQLQLQIMWAMGGGMAPAPAPVMFPAAGTGHYMQRMASMRARMPPFRTCLYSSNDAGKRVLRDR